MELLKTENRHKRTREFKDRVMSKENIANYGSIMILNIFIKGLGYIVIDSYFAYFYSEFLGVSAAVMATILSIGIVIDGVSDVGMGVILDRVITKRGKAKHWLLWMGIPCALSMILVFLAPQNASMPVKIVWATVTYNVYCCCMTAVRIPSQAMSSLGSDHNKVRALFGWFSSMGSTLAATVTSAVLVTTLQAFGGESVYGYRMTQSVFAVLTAVVIVACGFSFHEKRNGAEWKQIEDQYGHMAGRKASVTAGKQLRSIACNKYWWIYMAFHFFEACMDGCLYGCIAYYCKYVLNDTTAVATLLAIASLPQLIGQFVDLPLMRAMENLRIALLGVAFMIMGALIGFIWGEGSFLAVQIAVGIRHFGNGMFNGVRGSMLPRIVDYGEWKFDIRQDGMVQSGNSVIQKVSSAMITAVIGFLLTANGYVGGATAISPELSDAISFIFLKLPFFTALMNMILFLFFDLTDSRINQMRREIDQRHAAI